MKCTGVSFSHIALKGCCSVLGMKYILLHFNLCRCSSSFIIGDNIFISAGLCIAPVGFCAALCGGFHARGVIIRGVPSAAAVGLVAGLFYTLLFLPIKKSLAAVISGSALL